MTDLQIFRVLLTRSRGLHIVGSTGRRWGLVRLEPELRAGEHAGPVAGHVEACVVVEQGLVHDNGRVREELFVVVVQMRDRLCVCASTRQT